MVQVSYDVAMQFIKEGQKNVYVEYNGKRHPVVTPNGFVSFPVKLIKKGLWFIGD
jgi:hypothetical protein